MTDATPSPAPKHKKTRWGLLIAVLVLAALRIAWIQTNEELGESMQMMSTSIAVGLTLLALAGWFVFFTALRWRTRLLVPAIVVVLLVSLGFAVRFDGAQDGSGKPVIAWRWSPAVVPPDTRLTAPVVEPASDEAVPVRFETTPDDYPHFLGRGGHAVVDDVRLARDWSANPPRQVWRQPIGAGFSSFAVVGDLAVTQEQRGDDELIVCYQVPTGRPLWSHANRVRFKDPTGDGPRATPTIDGQRVYALGATGILDCLDGATGELLWTHDTLAEHDLKNLEWGKSNSPLIYDELVIVTGGKSADGKSGPSLIAFDKTSGEQVWQAGHDNAAYCTPELAVLADRSQIVIVNAGSVSGHDPTDGKLLWEYAWPGQWPKVSQPVPLDGERLLVTAGYGLGAVLLKVEGDAESSLSPAEVWKSKKMKPQFANVVLRDGFIYGLDDGVLACVGLANGERRWRKGRYGHGQILLVGDVLLIQAESGEVVLVEASPRRHHELTRFAAIEGKTWNNPALSGRRLLVRNDQEAACYELPLEQ
ncbi:MAG TPA: PQQ-binding-like beta-propeller repeat protein [Pirellulales bacterium]|nr:PQQ-binding-like beta-propeller repeat protein [Pirellulales bacterium]